jgi:hypothetical protein
VDLEVEKYIIGHVATFSRSEDDVSGTELAQQQGYRQLPAF